MSDEEREGYAEAAAPEGGPFSKGYKHRHGEPVSDACGDGKHGECTQDLTKCHCTYRTGHKVMHAYMNPEAVRPAAPEGGPQEEQEILGTCWLLADGHGGKHTQKVGCSEWRALLEAAASEPEVGPSSLTLPKVRDLAKSNSIENAEIVASEPNREPVCGVVIRKFRCTLPLGHAGIHQWDKMADSASQPEPRTSQDYAIEHAGYLATAAENYLKVRNEYDQKAATDGCETADIDLLSDHFRALQSAIYEFRKRANRAASQPERAFMSAEEFWEGHPEYHPFSTLSGRSVLKFAEAYAQARLGK